MISAQKLIQEFAENGATFFLKGGQLSVRVTPGRTVPRALVLSAKAAKSEIVEKMTLADNGSVSDTGLLNSINPGEPFAAPASRPRLQPLVEETEAAATFLAAVQGHWPGAKMMSADERAEEAQFRQELTMLRIEASHNRARRADDWRPSKPAVTIIGTLIEPGNDDAQNDAARPDCRRDVQT